MKKNILYTIRRYSIAGLGFILLLLLASCNSKRNEQEHAGNHATETDTMVGMSKNSKMEGHTNMDHLNEKADGHQQMNIGQGLDTLDEMYLSALPANQSVISKQSAVPVRDSMQQFTINGEGYITFDPRRNRKISVRISGRIERLFVKYNYQYVRKGEKIMEIYSPDLNTYISEYIYIRQKSNDRELMEKAKQKLLLLGLSNAQIALIDKNPTAPFTISIYSPFEGYVLFNPSPGGGGMSAPSTQGGMGSGMNSGAASASTGTASTSLDDNSIREGMYVSKDQTVFWINDFQTVWGIVAFSHENEKIAKPGLDVVVESELFTGQTFRSIVQMVEPVYRGAQKFTQVRLYFSTPNRKLKQNSLIRASALVNSSSLTVPASSVYYLGSTAIVWVLKATTKDGSNVFQARAIKIGNRSNEYIEVLKGLNSTEFVAKDAGYLADSETLIQY